MIAVMQAFAEGKKIEVSPKGANLWVPAITHEWDWSDFDYRIKPEPKHRPYTFEELQECMAKGKIAVKHKWHKSIYTITQVCDANSKEEKIQLSAFGKKSYNQLLEEYQWLDGSPCGVNEEE